MAGPPQTTLSKSVLHLQDVTFNTEPPRPARVTSKMPEESTNNFAKARTNEV